MPTIYCGWRNRHNIFGSTPTLGVVRNFSDYLLRMEKSSRHFRKHSDSECGEKFSDYLLRMGKSPQHFLKHPRL
ncbi:MAG: hypothetical protein F6K40_19045 [Okeania sp. SIO3I5]|uniref:hypothetical protein n=1 Tax=Okeania sp. SIO3I5 TaxID=2607805 RepID=UPI0013BD1BF7|nr:hypothetical protein [Okeania sp. SIO3I5]NEQ38245.1 hypothetical protein [Okeania sp. SIO3I5]